jgi:hypothetical protein
MFSISSRPAARVAAAAVLAGVLVTFSPLCGSASAHEPRPATPTSGSGTASDAYSTPVAALGGKTPAQYIARHEERVTGFIGV